MVVIKNMIVRILFDKTLDIGFYHSVPYEVLDYNEDDDKEHNVTDYLILSSSMAEVLKKEHKHESLDRDEHPDSYGIYEMAEADIAWWLLQI